MTFSANRPLATHKSKMCEQNAIYFGEGLIRGKRTKFVLQIVLKALKCPLEYKNFPGEHTPEPP